VNLLRTFRKSLWVQSSHRAEAPKQKQYLLHGESLKSRLLKTFPNFKLQTDSSCAWVRILYQINDIHVSHYIYLGSALILSYLLCLGFPSFHYLSGFTINNFPHLWSSRSPAIRLPYPPTRTHARNTLTYIPHASGHVTLHICGSGVLEFYLVRDRLF
jgi:hypothetical protein